MKSTRRNFLLASLFASSYTVVSAVRSSAKESNSIVVSQADEKQNAEIIVIGAGVAGLSAAKALQKQGKKVIVLEAQERIGGRVWTDRSWKDLPIDLGASWIHGLINNPIKELTKKFKIKIVSTSYNSVSTHDSQGKQLTDSQEERIDNRWNQLLTKINNYRQQLEKQDAEDMSLQKALDNILAKMNLSSTELTELNFAINSTIEHEYAADIKDLSLYYWDQGDELKGGDALLLDGYDQIVTVLAEGLDIRPRHIVQKIEYNNQGVKVITNQGVFQASRAVITIPLGVLKSGAVEFSPALPSRKIAAINRLGVGVLNKVYLRFPKVFWPQDSHWLAHISQTKGEWTEFLNIHQYTGKPVLLGFNAATYGSKIESLSDRETVDEAMKVLRKMYGTSIPNPEAWFVTRWGKNPFFRGSYSYIPPNASDQDIDALAAPVANRLFFAGEATSRQYAATVHGAYLSGQREAKLLLSL